ncbi:hypothetical protein EJB05_14818 [Eragrostis curvula]|uniref:Uncharacterized protein n=1 Tax=Eragrostis curvula TaxID=38414 RepID=A0A5J9VXZ2_9POAL|nr:hypothetical protein EJB05_14818 [Eragrostis curvula]
MSRSVKEIRVLFCQSSIPRQRCRPVPLPPSLLSPSDSLFLTAASYAVQLPIRLLEGRRTSSRATRRSPSDWPTTTGLVLHLGSELLANLELYFLLPPLLSVVTPS